ncbi:MAG: hypothetical protein JRF49_06200 [Deltaproteobacteria bacterium]|nr:hypothetical protein [Deltaproteobacteria bacterium]
MNGWEFLDQHDGKKTIAMTMDWEPPGHKWFYYPLLGKWLQNDIAYISARHKQEVPTRIHRGLIRGADFSIWLRNLKKENVDYILVQKPWPIELRWMLHYKPIKGATETPGIGIRLIKQDQFLSISAKKLETAISVKILFFK